MKEKGKKEKSNVNVKMCLIHFGINIKARFFLLLCVVMPIVLKSRQCFHESLYHDSFPSKYICLTSLLSHRISIRNARLHVCLHLCIHLLYITSLQLLLRFLLLFLGPYEDQPSYTFTTAFVTCLEFV